MNGSEAMVRTMLASSLEVCFANPGTSEMHFVSALDRFTQMRCVLGLFEGVVTGAADGYYRMAGKPAATLLHLGPGLGNGLANLHNAKRARSGIVNIVGQHATDHIANDAPLTSDIEGIARPMSHWVKTTASANEAPVDTAAAITQACGAEGRIATLILPADAAWSECETGPVVAQRAAPASIVRSDAIETIARLIRECRDPGTVALLLGGRGTRAKAAELAGRIAAHTGCQILAETKNARSERGAGRVNLPQIPYPMDQSLALLKEVRVLILIGAAKPVAFFAFPGKPRMLMPDESEVHTLATPAQDIEAALDELCRTLGAARTPPAMVGLPNLPDGLPSGKPTSEHIGHVVARMLPENAIVIDEAVTTGRQLQKATVSAAPHDWLEITGGSIGYGLPAAVGAAIACPNRKVLAIIGDGSAMYTLQALWTMAREGLNITVVICANRSYKILYGELERMGGPTPGPNATRMLTLAEPALDWVALAKGHGIEGSQVATLEAFADALRIAMRTDEPRLIELLV